MAFSYDSTHSSIRNGFQEGEKVLMLLHQRFEKSMQSTRDGTQLIKDLQELVTNGIEGLCKVAGIPSFQTTYIFQHRLVKNWLEEVSLKKLLFALLLAGKGAEVYNLRAAIDTRFGAAYASEIANAAGFLAQQFVKASEKQDFEQMSLVLRGTFGASPALEDYRKQFS